MLRMLLGVWLPNEITLKATARRYV